MRSATARHVRAAAPIAEKATRAPAVAAFHDLALSAMLGLQFALLFVATPLAALGYLRGRHMAELLVIAFMVLVIAVSRSRLASWIAVVSVGCSLIGATLDLTRPSPISSLLMHCGSEIGIAACGYIIARAIFAPGPVTVHRVIGAVVLYLDAALWFSTTYRLLRDLAPMAFNGIPAGASETESFPAVIYFSLVTLTSTGYGDILPIHPFARSVANIESIFGQLYPATLIAVLVTQHLELRRTTRSEK